MVETYTATLQEGQGDSRWFLDTLSTVKAGSSDGAQFSFMEYRMPEGHETPFHVHDDEDEAIFVLEGRLTVYFGEGRQMEAGPGSYVHVGKQTPHGIRATEEGRVLVVNGRGQFGEFVRRMSEPAAARELPTPTPPDMDRMMAVAAEHGLRVLGPLPVPAR